MKLTRGEFIYHLFKIPVRFYLHRKFNITVVNNPLENIKGSYLLLGHHVNAFDPIISNAFSNTLIRYVAADANQDNGLKKMLLDQLESIPFSKNRADSKAIHEIMKHVKMGHPIGLYPEGGRNWDGSTDTIIPSTAKLIKLMRIPVYAVFYKGGHLSKPRWAYNFRKGKIVLEIKKILDKNIIEQKSSEELYELLVDKLNYNEFDWQKQNRVIFKGKNLAEGIERLLYICPNCLALNRFKSKGNKFHCDACKKEYTFNYYGEIEGCSQFNETVSWNKWQKSLLPTIMEKGFLFTNSKISLEKIHSKDNTRDKQFVSLSFSRNQLLIRYENQDAQIIPIENLSGLSTTFQDVVEFFVDSTKYRFVFNKKEHMSIMLFYDLLKKIKEENKNELRLEYSR